ncbi:MAG: hypothetical protein FWG42_09390, partial [Clostridiales bacterium]|nr:hypothetical protein [Clostridiales bacterium]
VELQAVHDKYLLPEPAQKVIHHPPPIPSAGQERFLRIGLERDMVFAALWAGGRRYEAHAYTHPAIASMPALFSSTH